MGSRPPLAGFNHNIRYGDRVYHVQTEDSGIENPHIFTHLFLGGLIISSARTDYGHLLAEADCDEKVRKLMQEQHKRLMKELRRGAFDAKIIETTGSVQATDAEPAFAPMLPPSATVPSDETIVGGAPKLAPPPAAGWRYST
jgi:hypothetical protein